jgi:hypothetical protein
MRRKVYIETSVASYLTARPNRDLIVAAHQEITAEWWTTHRPRFDLYVSELVLLEASKGDPTAAISRLNRLAGIPSLPINDAVQELARSFVERRIVPEKVVEDALHVAVAAIQGMDFLLTWNCRHIANAEIIKRLDAACADLGLRLPILCTPEQ